jgi:hypothetical protein
LRPDAALADEHVGGARLDSFLVLVGNTCDDRIARDSDGPAEEVRPFSIAGQELRLVERRPARCGSDWTLTTTGVSRGPGPSWRSAVDLQTFYTAASCAIETALLYSSDGRARRRGIRDAILGTLEHFAVITRTRGGRP